MKKKFKNFFNQSIIEYKCKKIHTYLFLRIALCLHRQTSFRNACKAYTHRKKIKKHVPTWYCLSDNHWLIACEPLRWFIIITALFITASYTHRVVVKSNFTSENCRYCLPFFISTFGMNFMTKSTFSVNRTYAMTIQS